MIQVYKFIDNFNDKIYDISQWLKKPYKNSLEIPMYDFPSIFPYATGHILEKIIDISDNTIKLLASSNKNTKVF